MNRTVHGRNGHRKGRRSSKNALATGVDEHIVYTETSDGLELRGALIRPKAAAKAAGPLLVWVHTRQKAFAEQEYVHIGRLLAARGYHFLTIDTRGHDFGAWYRTHYGPTLQGSAWERFTDCVHDIDAWVDATQDMGYKNLVLIGHGFGGAKLLYFQAQRQLPQVGALVLASSGSSVRDKLPTELAGLAERMVAEGRGIDLLPLKSTGENYPSSVSAEYYILRSIMGKELYGTGTLPPAIARIRCPLIAWYGSIEDRPTRPVAEFLEWLAANAVKAPQVDFSLIEGVDFFYNGKEEVVVQHLAQALERIGLVPDRQAA